jgi:hypothetical protein
MIFVKDTMNNTKVAVLFGNKRDHHFYINNELGLIEAFSHLPKNFTTEFFCNTETMNAYERNGQIIWFKNTVKAMKWGVNVRYEPNIVICVGSPNYGWDKILTEDYKKIFIYDSYEYPKKEFEWDAVIVPTFADKLIYPNAEVATVYNSTIFKPQDSKKYFNKIYPQLIYKLDLFFDIQNDENTITRNPSKDVFYLSDFPSVMLNDLFNQSKMTLLVEQDNDIELALSSMACQIPVISVVDNKASRLLGVFPSLATTPTINEVIDYVSSFKGHKFDVSEFTVENFAKKLKKLL